MLSRKVSKVLFYLQPETIRNDPKAFEWIFQKYRALAAKLSSNNISTSLLVDDAIKHEHLYEKNGCSMLSPSDFGIRFSGSNSDVRWKNILTNQEDYEKIELLNAVYSTFEYDLVFCWNFDAALKHYCTKRNIHTIFQELGLVRNPMTYQMDFDGLLWNSSLQRAYLKFSDIIKPNNDRLDNFLLHFTTCAKHSKEEIAERLNLGRGKPIILIPLQVEDDSNIVVGSPFKTMPEFVNHCITHIADISSYSVIIKQHPVRHIDSLPLNPQYTVISDEFDSLSLINSSDYVITINSSSGFEALCFSKKVLTFGNSPYCGLGLTFDLNPKEDRKIILTDISPNELFGERNESLRSFLSFALFKYHQTEDEFQNVQFYLNLFRLLEKTKEKDVVYLLSK